MNRIIYDQRIIDDEGSNLLGSLDFLFISAGGDYRAYEVLRKWNQSSSFTIQKIIIIDFDERKNVADLIYSAQYEQYKEITKFHVIRIDASIFNPSGCIKNLKSRGIEFSFSDKIGIDISCFTKPYFFSLIQFFAKIVKVSSLDIYYTEPKSYKFSNGLYDSYTASSGPTKIKELTTGNDAQNLRRILVMILGFDGDISREIDEEVSPTKTIIINGFPGFSPKFKDISLINNEKLVSNEKNIKLLYSRANNPFDIYNLLERIVTNTESPKYLNVAPLGTKPMALGICLYAIHNPNVRVIYPIPEKYENITTNECWNSLGYKIPLTMN